VPERCVAKVTIVNRLGLHARPAMAFVDAASAFKARVSVRYDAKEVDGKSIMEMLMLAAMKGAELEVECDGSDARECLGALQKLVASGFEEE
jgi:phosphocarrier protein HPr